MLGRIAVVALGLSLVLAAAAQAANAGIRKPTASELRQAKRVVGSDVRIVKMRVSTSRSGRTLATALTSVVRGPAKGVADCSNFLKRRGKMIDLPSDIELTAEEEARGRRLIKRVGCF